MITEITCKYFDKNLCKSCTRLDKENRLPNLPNELISISKKVNPWVLAQDLNPFHLRSKARMSVSLKNEEITIGILDEKLEGISLLECPQHRKIINHTLKYLKDLIKKYSLTIYSIPSKTGELKSIILQTVKNEDQLRLRFILRSKDQIEKVKQIGQELKLLLNIDILVSANIQPIPHQIPEGPEEYQLIGMDFLWEEYNCIKIAFPNQSFMQATPEVAEKLYYDTTCIVSQYNEPIVLDYFSGAGGFSLNVAKKSKQVHGIEFSREAVNASKISAAENKINNVIFTEANLLDENNFIKEINPDIIICNPPRRGLGDSVIESIITNPTGIFIYSSCNYLSFLRDYDKISYLYEVLEITPYEMFPLTEHFEVLVHMKRID